MAEAAQTDSKSLEWTVWPTGRRPVASVAVAAVIVGISVATVLSYGNPWFGVMAFIGLFVAVASHYLPTTYSLDATGVQLQTPIGSRSRQWETVAAAVDDDTGVFLSPASEMTWMDRRRGIYLRCPENLDEVVDFVTQHVGAGGDDDGTD